MFKKISQLFGPDPHERKINTFAAIADQINGLEPDFEKLSDEQLKTKTVEYKSRLAKGETLDQLLPEAFATVREASKRVLGQRHYDTQIICGINLHQGAISELRTGEGKTLSSTLPLYLNALEGKGAHLVTVNDYLARRDARWMGAVYHFLELSVGVLQGARDTSGQTLAFVYDPEERNLKEENDLLRPCHRRDSYAADITYGTNSEFGFDYLRDNITMRWEDRVQRGHHFAIIDEVDNILIDEARTPLIISGQSHEDSANYVRMAQVAKALNPEDYEVEEKDHAISLTALGVAHVEDLLGEPLSDPDRPEDVTPEQARLIGYLEQALRAQYLFFRNKDYIVQGGDVVIVDEFTGRMMPGRRWSDGLHQAVEAKEGVKVQAENVTEATITIQNYFRMYEKLAGMTGTAETEQEEFFRIYKLEVLPIPTNLEYRAMRADSGLAAAEGKDEEGYRFTYYYNQADNSQKPIYFKRKDYPDVIYRNGEGKLRAIVREIAQFYAVGRPQLVGSTSVENSEKLSGRLNAESIRRLMQTLLLRQAWLRSKGKDEEDYSAAPELELLKQPLEDLRVPEMRRLGTQFGMTSMDPGEESNKAMLLSDLNLEPSAWERLKPIFEGGIPHKVLNARKHTEESLIIAGAGAYGAVTIATNMAGRGVDIKLGGEIPEDKLSRLNQIIAAHSQADPYNMTMQQRLETVKALPQELDEDEQAAVDGFLAYMQNMDRVRVLGGLHVIGSERHEARRIDNQLRGRAARQGDPGSSRFYLALDDDLMRLFGGSNMEGLLSRFKIDENVPIELGMIGKMVEQSQTRVEGANFDVRKHLLEYDDVLNSQRNRIYEQRDKIFKKDDLHDDVNQMLQTELKARVGSAFEGKEGLWKLLAYLEDLQPAISTPWVEYPSFTQSLAMSALGTPNSSDALKEKLLQMSREAVDSENFFLERSVADLLDKGDQTLKTQMAERGDALDAYLETFDPEQPHDLAAELTTIIQTPVRLTSAQQKELFQNPMAMKPALRETLKAGLTLQLVRRALLTLERRFNEDWPIKATDLAIKPWAEVKATILEQVRGTLQKRVERLFGAEGEVARDLEANKALLETSVTDEASRLKTLQLTTQGARVTFDPRSHKRVIKTSDRLNYLFSMAKIIDRKAPSSFTEQILAHLYKAEEKFVTVFGNAEWEHIRTNNFGLNQTPEDTQAVLKERLGENEFAGVADTLLSDISPEAKDKVIPVLGGKAQNRIYRQLLLETITDSWVEYLTKMEALRVSISMESYAQQDPLTKYKQKASTMFSELLSEVRQKVIGTIFLYRPIMPETNTKAPAGRPEDLPAEASPEFTAREAAQSKAASDGKKKRKRH
jgi:preprotein translocase subunit SecA